MLRRHSFLSEKLKCFIFSNQVEDDGTPPKSTTVTLNLVVNDLNDNDPTLTGPFTFTVLETDGASSTVYYTASASSNDGPDDDLTYSLSDTTFFDISSSKTLTLILLGSNVLANVKGNKRVYEEFESKAHHVTQHVL